MAASCSDNRMFQLCDARKRQAQSCFFSNYEIIVTGCRERGGSSISELKHAGPIVKAAMVAGSMELVMSLMLLCFWLVLCKRIRGKIFHRFPMLAMFIVLSDVWIICNSEWIQFFTDQTALVSSISFLAVAAMPPVLLAALQEIAVKRVKSWNVLMWILIGYLAFCAVNERTDWISVGYLIGIEHVLILLTIVFAIWEMMREGWNSSSQERKKILAGFKELALFSLLSIAIFYLSPSVPCSLPYCVGLIGFLYLLADSMIEKLIEDLNQNANMQAYRQMAYTDVLTGLENRAAFAEATANLTMQLDTALVMLDINDLKAVNDLYGHQEGDRMIVDAAECIDSAFGELGHCYRIGGDEFAVLIQKTTEKQIERAFEMLDELLIRRQEDRVYPLRVAKGYGVRMEEQQSADDLIRTADRRMYQNKRKMKQSVLQNAEEK